MTHKEKYNDTATVDVIIPAYRPGSEFGELLQDSGYEYGRAVLEQRMGEMSDP